MASIFQVSLPFFFSLPMGNPRWPPFSKLVYHLTLWELCWKIFLSQAMRQIEFFAVYESSLDGSSSNFGIACWWEIAVTAQLSLNWRTLEVFRPQTLFSIIVLWFEFLHFKKCEF
jgi:hypothetical protein